MLENTKAVQHWRKSEVYCAAAKAVVPMEDPIHCHAHETPVRTTQNIADDDSKPYDLHEAMGHDGHGQCMQEFQARRAAVFPGQTLREFLDKVQQKVDNIEKGLTELDRNMESIREDLSRQEEKGHANVASNAYNSGEASIADTEDLEYDLSESDELCDFGAPANEAQPLLQDLFSPAAVHAINLEALSHQTYLLKKELTEPNSNIRTIHDLASTTLCMIEACADPKLLRSGDEHCLISKISANIEESQAAFETLRLQENCILSTTIRHLSIAFSALLDLMFENAYQHSSSGSVSEHSRTAATKTCDAGQQRLSVGGAQVMASDEDYPPPLPQSPTRIFSGSGHHGEECEGGYLAPTGLAIKMYEPQKILLPRGFTVHSLDSRHPNLSFPDPSMVIHFQEDATREYIQDVLRSEYEAYEQYGISQYKARCWDFEREQRIWLMEAIEPWLAHCGKIANFREAWNHFKFGKGRTVLLSGNNVVETPYRGEIRIRGWKNRLEEGRCLLGTCRDDVYADNVSTVCEDDNILRLIQSGLKMEDAFIKDDGSQNNHGWSDEKYRSILTKKIGGETIYWSIKLPEGFTIPSRDPYQASVTFLDESICLNIPYDTDEDTKKLIFKREQRYDHTCIRLFEGDQRVWLTDAINMWWKSIGHSTKSLKEWEDSGKKSGCLALVNNNHFILRPCGNIKVDGSRLRNHDPHKIYESAKTPPIPIRHPEFYHTRGVLRHFSPSTISMNPKIEGPMVHVPCAVTFLPAGFSIPSHTPHQGDLVFRNATYAYNFPLGGVTSNDLYRVLQEEAGPAKYAILTVQTLQQKLQLKENILAWWATMPLELKGSEDWPGFQKGDTYIIIDQCSVDRQIYEGRNGSNLRDGGTDPEIRIPVKGEVFEHRGFEDRLKSLHDEIVDQNTEACGESSPLAFGEPWAKLANLLQMRNSYLEPEVKRLQDTNGALRKDVQRRFGTLARLKKDLNDAQSERTIAMAKWQDLKAQAARSKKNYMLPTTVLDDKDSAYGEISSSASNTSTVDCSTDITTKCTYGSRQNDCSHLRSDTADACSQNQPIARQHTSNSHAATSFYFFPQTSLILLMRSPPLLYQWPSKTTLSQIHYDLIHRHNYGVKDDRILEIMDILDIREILDIQLPDLMHDEVIKISIPDLGNVDFSGKNISVAAWETFGVDAGNSGQDWKDWWDDVVQPESYCVHSPTYSDRSSHADTNEAFRDWPWDTDAAGPVQYQDEQTPFPEKRSHHICCNNTYPSLRGGRGNNLD